MGVPLPGERLTLGGKMAGEPSKQSLESFGVDSAHHTADVDLTIFTSHLRDCQRLPHKSRLSKTPKVGDTFGTF